MINWDAVREAFVEKYDPILVNAGRAFDEWRRGLEADPDPAYEDGYDCGRGEGYDSGFREGYDAGYGDGKEDAVG